MIENNKEIPMEYVGIRQVWLRGIDDCRKAISQMANLEASGDHKYEMVAGPRTVVHTVDALFQSLVDVGEATILSDVDRWMDANYRPQVDKIWYSKKKKESDTVSFPGLDDEEEKDEKEDGKNKPLTTYEKWWAHSRISIKLYHEILIILNFYGLLFPEPYRGYSNVDMEETL